MILKADIAGPRQLADCHRIELVARSVGTLAPLIPLIQVDRRHLFCIENHRDLRPYCLDRHVVPLARWLLCVHRRSDQVVECTGIVDPASGRVIDRNLDTRMDRIGQVAHAKKNSRIAALGQLVVEVELEVVELLFIDDQVGPAAVWVQPVALNVARGNRIVITEHPSLAATPVEDRLIFLLNRWLRHFLNVVGLALGRFVGSTTGQGIPAARVGTGEHDESCESGTDHRNGHER